MHFLRAFEGPLLAVMRIVVGLLFACRGAQKLFGLFGGVHGRGMTPPLRSPFGAAGIIELAAAALFSFVFLYLVARGPGPTTLGAPIGRPDLA